MIRRSLRSLSPGLSLLLLVAALLPSQASSALTPAEEDAWLTTLLARSPHRRALLHAATAYPPAPPSPLADVLTSAATGNPPNWLFAVNVKAWPAKKGRRLYGYLPYWTMKSAKLYWGELTQLAYFAAQLKSDGTFGKLNGWGSKEAKTLIATAHQHGVQVPLTITLFSKSGISAVLATAAKRTALVKAITTLVIQGGGDGVNIDFEGMAKADKAHMNAFIIELNTVLKKQLPGADVTLATPAVDWSRAWDYATLLENSDGLMVMAYGLHWSGGDPGPNLPMAKGGVWKHKTLPWVVDDYAKWGKAKNLAKVIIGLPLYGHAWPSSSGKPGAKSLAKAKSVTFEKALAEAPSQGGWKWDADSKSSYYAYKSGGKWTQTWVDTAKSFSLRVAYLDQRGTQMGLWALGYADKMPPVWQAIKGFMDKGKGGAGTGADAGGADAGGTDAGSTDAGGTTDAGVHPDTTSADADNSKDAGGPGTPDATADGAPWQDGGGLSDAAGAPPADGAAVDADTGTPGSDAGGSDAGGSDAGGSDAGDSDAGGAPLQTNLSAKPDSGCSVSTTPGHSGPHGGGGVAWLGLGLLAVVGLGLRRRFSISVVPR